MHSNITSNTIDKRQAIIELFFAGLLWGYGFLATKWALKSFSVFDVLFYRFFITYLLSELIHRLFNKRKNIDDFFELKNAFWPGVLMAAFIIPQTIGLLDTSASNSGFITTLYVVIVPLINQFILRKSISPLFYFLAFMALVGSVLLMNLRIDSLTLNKGDVWTLICSFFAAIQIIVLGDKVHNSKSDFRLNSFQNFWTLVCILPFFIYQSDFKLESIHFISWFGIVTMAIGSGIIAFTIQVRSQRVLAPEIASQMFLLESPFAFLFGYLFLDETLTLTQTLGALIILMSSFLSLRVKQTSHSK